MTFYLNKDKVEERIQAALLAGEFDGPEEAFDKRFAKMFPEIVGFVASGGSDKQCCPELIHFEPPASTATGSTAPPPIIQEAATGKDFNATWTSGGPDFQPKKDKKDKKDKK